MSTFGPISSKRAGSNAEASVVDVHPEFEHVPDTEIEHADVRVAEPLKLAVGEPHVVPILVRRGFYPHTNLLNKPARNTAGPGGSPS